MALLEVGRITKPHGIRGEVIVELVTNRTERLKPGARFDAPGRTLIVERSSAHQGRWIVAFAGVPDRTAAEQLRNVVLRAESIDDPSSLWVHELIGSEVFDTAGIARGTVTSVVANPASDLLELDSGELVPLRFVVSRAEGRVVVDAPDGLFGEP